MKVSLVVDDVELAVHRIVDDHLTQGLVVVERVRVDPICGPAPAEIDIKFSRMILHHAVVGLRRVDVLHEMVKNIPLPEDVAVEIELDDPVGP